MSEEYLSRFGFSTITQTHTHLHMLTNFREVCLSLDCQPCYSVYQVSVFMLLFYIISSVFMVLTCNYNTFFMVLSFNRITRELYDHNHVLLLLALFQMLMATKKDGGEAVQQLFQNSFSKTYKNSQENVSFIV